MEKLKVNGTVMDLSKGAEGIVHKARRLSVGYSSTGRAMPFPAVNHALICLAFADLSHPLYLLLTKRFSLSNPIITNSLHAYLFKTKEDAPTEENLKKEAIFFQHAEEEAKQSESVLICEDHLLAAIFKFRDEFNYVLKLFEEDFGITQEHLLKFIKDIKHTDVMREVTPTIRSSPLDTPLNLPYSAKRSGCDGRTGMPASILNEAGRNLNSLAREGCLVQIIGRDKEILAVQEVLARREQNNVILIGHPGVGKTAIVEGFASRLVKGDVPERLKNKTIIEINIGALISGTSLRGQFEEKIQAIIKECQQDENLILFFSDIHRLVGAGDTGASDAANLLKPYLLKGDLRCIGTTTVSDYQKYIEKDPSLARGFQVVRVDEPSIEVIKQIVLGTLKNYERHHQVKITEDAADAAIEMSDRYIKDRYLPGKAMSLLDRAASRISLSKEQDKTVTRKTVAAIVSEITDIPMNQILFSKEDLFTDLEEKLKQRVLGQEEAIRRITDVLQLTKYEMDLKPERPDGVFLLAGPTGTGKTELAKSLAEALFGSEKELLRFDMSEFMEKHNVAKLIGSPPGYQGSAEGGALTNAVRANPYTVILFDEVEKAHPDVFKLFLQIFDDGRLTDAKGMTVSFSFTTIIMTSNLGSRNLDKDEISKLPPARVQDYIRSRMEPEVKKFFPPELINRLDDVLYFNFLSLDTVKAIAKSKISKVLERFVKKGKHIEVGEDVYLYLVEHGFNPEYGARFLNRAIESFLLKPLTKYLLNNPKESKAYCRLEKQGNVVSLKSSPSAATS